MTEKRLLWLILALALMLRVVYALAQDPLGPYTTTSADSGWYLDNGYALISGHMPGTPIPAEARLASPRYFINAYALFGGRALDGTITEVSHLSSPPLYFIVIGIPRTLLSPAAAVIAVRVLQAFLSTTTCYFAYRLALRLTGRVSAGLLAASALAFSPAFIIEAAQILTETLYIFFLTGGVWLYIESISNRQDAKKPLTPADLRSAFPSPTQAGTGAKNHAQTAATRHALLMRAMAAALFGLATLTRAVLLAFPLALVIHLLLVRAGWRRIVLFLLVYALVVSTWTIYSVATWKRFVIAGEGLPAFLYVGATGWDGPQQVDQRLGAGRNPGGQVYVQAAESAIGADPLGWVQRRVGELAGAYLQPHGTTFYPGASLRDIALAGLRQDRSLAGLVALTHGDAFWPKLVLYAMHYTALLAGLIGMWMYHRRWVFALPMIGLIAYMTLVHFFLLALPRYLFPNEVFWWVFAAAAITYPFARRANQPRAVTHP